MEKKKKIDDLFKSELGSYTETPPPAVWEALEERLDAAPKPRGPLTWLTYTAMLCLFIVAAIWLATGLTGRKDQLAQQTSAEHSTTTTGQPGNNNAPNMDYKGNTPAGENTATSNSTDNENNTTTANTPATDPNRVSNNKPAVYTSTGAPVPAATGNSTGKAPNTGQPTTHNTGIPGRHDAKTGSNNKRSTKDHTGKKNNGNNSYNNSRPSGKNNKSTNGTYAAADEDADNTDDQKNHNSATQNGDNDAATGSTKQEESGATDNSNTKSEGSNDPASQQGTKNDPAKFAPNDAPKPKKPKAKFDRFEAGVKAGYEQGFIADAAQKGVFAPFLQYRFSKKIGIMLQPAIKYANVSGRQIGDATRYYNTTSDTMMLTSNVTSGPIIVDSVPVATGYTADYLYKQYHDSIIKTNWTGGKYVEVELPVLAKYYVSEKFSVYGGVNIGYSKLVGLTEHTYIEKDILRTTVYTQYFSVNVPTAPARPDYKYTGTPYSQYTGPQFQVPTASTFRIGYMAGFSWEFEDRWLIDALVQQTFIKPNIQAGFNTYTPLSVPYFRLSLGYKIIK